LQPGRRGERQRYSTHASQDEESNRINLLVTLGWSTLSIAQNVLAAIGDLVELSTTKVVSLEPSADATLRPCKELPTNSAQLSGSCW
jgi:hypothetical protein